MAIQLQSKRLILRQGTLRDAAETARFFKANKKFHNRPNRASSFYTPLFWRKQITRERRDYDRDHGITLYLYLKENPKELIGEVVFDQIIRGVFQSCFLGYLLGEEYEGKGLMTEALKIAIPFVFDKMGLHRISANHVPSNKRSCRVMNRLGFKTIGLQPKYLKINGRWLDHEEHVLISKLSQ
jgi:ribosomal-protein-alanine N-acetyltransferase